ncbi:MAG: hypothetical protein NTV49_09895 [Kiritimatiellaeota bacterium]|nr:hypothetical protein [Kiritimatiellota bacterium]
MRIPIAIILMLAASAVPLPGADFHVAPDGDDRNPGTLEKPFDTVYLAERDPTHPQRQRLQEHLADEVAQALRGRVKAGETVACVGDSLTYGSHMAGEGTATGTTYPAFLAGMLRQPPTTGN